jgi:hypothetical protein
MRRLLVLALAATAAATVAAGPASATCMETYNKGHIRMGSCAAPGGPVTSYWCYDDHCVWY